MEEDSDYNKVESVIGCHVEDAVTFWAQNTNRQNDILKTSCTLAEICPQASPVFGNPDLTKIYGGCFSEDKCWYRCKVLQVISGEKCQVLYIDYGNSEILNQSEIVEIPANLQFPSVANKYKLWGLQIPVNQDLNQFDQGRKLLNSLVFEKEIKTRWKDEYQDGTIVAEAECGLLDIGKEMVKRGFVERCSSPTKSNNYNMQPDPSLYQSRTTKAITWPSRTSPSACNRTSPSACSRGGFGDHVSLNGRSEINAANHMPFSKEKLMTCDPRRVSNISLAKIKQDQKMIEENGKLKEEKEALRGENRKLLNQHEELESKVKMLTYDLEKEKKAHTETLEYIERILPRYVGVTVRNLAAKFEKLKETRQISISARFGEDLSEAVKVVTNGCLAAPLSLEKLKMIGVEYYSAQEEIRSCKDVDQVQSLILQRNEIQKQFYSTVEEFIVEVDDLPLSDRLETLQKLQGSLEAIYGEAHEAEGSEIFNEFFEWKSVKLEEFNCVRSATDSSLQNLVTCFNRIIKFFDMTTETFFTSEEVVDNVDDVLKKAELAISQELDISLVELDEADKKIILNIYSEVMQKIQQEQRLLNIVYCKYLDSIEFKKQIVKWLETSPNIDDLLLIKKRLKILKAQLRWKLVEKSNLEEADDYSESEMAKIKEEITGLRNSVFQEIYNEQEEYEKLNHLVQKWFPELPLLHPEAGILKYMNSGGLLTVSLERDLLDAEPMKELSTKRPLICSEIQGQKVLLKGYAVDMNTETGVVERAAKYHQVWRELKEESGLMQLMFLFLCKSDPLAYLMVPYYAGASLGALQTSTPLSQEETLKVMKGVVHGLYMLHRADIVHGSLHEYNVFAVNREKGIVGDFDFTKAEGQRASMNSVALYGLSLTSPEVKKGQPPSPASDMYAYGCLLYWLLIGNQEFKIKQDGTPQMDGLNVDNKLKSLLLNLLCCYNRMTAKQVLNNDCFLLPEVIPDPLENEPTECENKGEINPEIVSEGRQKNELEPEKINPDS
ncbi:serine/threonine-protein kinase 31 isoform X2 [Hemicordylus capensis]|uniref:serine/threonine-protein kinase 31 isoform X2 n=1 Tax=Hemicordylus capensis TaxID=884348 RepID=UPI0023043B88|nr:serine/threonine-protein kinase 31 isoform X2 [Hemicordylus capensis]XP_053117857.1 serine/threonine-protein kinase 31 isoform X2 [Hemicordylus capensis]XP_053117858.1 serine/threonine-protein kinase 31 isoform X2 [Hemicordylus capensis]